MFRTHLQRADNAVRRLRHYGAGHLRSLRSTVTRPCYRPSKAPLVLLVEDDAGTRDALVALLRLDGWDVAAACDGEEALARLSEQLPDVIVTDYMMPNLDGLEMIERIKQDRRLADVPIVLVSAIGIDAESRGSVEVFLQKPIDLSELREVLTRLIGR